MKKREWDKDIFNYEKAREWLRKNHLPVLFFLAILAVPILLIAVRYAVTHFPAISDTAIANKLSKNSLDFVTPALYYFSIKRVKNKCFKNALTLPSPVKITGEELWCASPQN